MANPEHVELVRGGSSATWGWHHGRLDLRDADLSGIDLRDARLDQCDLRGARLVGANLTGSRLQEVNLTGAHLIRSSFDDAQLGGSCLRNALLCSATCRRAVLVHCDLSDSNLSFADLAAANLSHARVAGAILNRTTLVDVQFHHVAGLDLVVHGGPSELGTHSLLRYGHEMPASFLRGVGLPDSFIRFLPSIIASARPVDFYSIFLCAAGADSELARRLHHDLQGAGVRCWFRHAHAELGEIDGSLRLHDRTIVLWSADASNDPAVARELRDDRAVRPLVVRLDGTPLPAVPSTPIDFTQWRDFRCYAQSFDRLLERLSAR